MRSFRLLLLGTLFLFVGQVAHAKKYTYTITYNQAWHNGEEITNAAGKEFKGTIKNHTKRIPIAELNDGSLLFVEFWITKDGVGSSKARKIQHKYYLKENGKFRLMCVTKKFVLNDKHIENGEFAYEDPTSGETFKILYKLKMEG